MTITARYSVETRREQGLNLPSSISSTTRRPYESPGPARACQCLQYESRVSVSPVKVEHGTRLPSYWRPLPPGPRLGVMGLRAGRRGPDRERTFTMDSEPTHETHAPGSTELDNSHYVTERLVYVPSVQPTIVQLLPVHSPPPIQVIGTPLTSGRLLDGDFPSFTFGNILSSIGCSDHYSPDNRRTEPRGYIAVVIPGGVSGATPSDSCSI